MAGILIPHIVFAFLSPNPNTDIKNTAYPKTPNLKTSNYPIDFANSTVYRPIELPVSSRRPLGGGSATYAGNVSQRHTPLTASRAVAPERLAAYLESKGSPLAPFASELLESPYWSTIIGICTIEQYSCSHLPNGTNWNLYGLMKPGGGLQYFATATDGLAAINAFLSRAEERGRTTIESFRGWYCVNRNYPGNVCPTWETVVLRVKAETESL